MCPSSKEIRNLTASRLGIDAAQRLHVDMMGTDRVLLVLVAEDAFRIARS